MVDTDQLFNTLTFNLYSICWLYDVSQSVMCVYIANSRFYELISVLLLFEVSSIYLCVFHHIILLSKHL